GPPGHDVAVAQLVDRASAARVGAAFHFPIGLAFAAREDLGLDAAAVRVADGYALSVRSERFAQAVAIDGPGFVPDDNYFHLEPGVPHTVHLRGDGDLDGRVQALNASSSTKILVLA